MNTEKLSRAKQSRVNGAKSKGPVTAGGKARSALNNTRHGMYSSRVVLENECPELYALLHSLYTNLLQPEDIVEKDLVESMVNARWRIRRLESAQTANMNLTLSEHRQQFHQKFGPGLDPAIEQALTFQVLAADAKAFDSLSRFEERLHRVYERSYRLLMKHRAKKGKRLPGEAELHHLEAGLPDNTAPPTPAAPDPQTAQNEGFEPEPRFPAKLAILAILAFLLTAFYIRPFFASLSIAIPLMR